jgi:hypothetical protein
MELNDLKLAWNKFSSKDATQHQLDEEAIYDMLKKRTKNLIERIDRNIKIGFGVLVLLTVFFVLDDFFLTPILAGNIEIPTWILIIDGISTLFILSTFIYFSLSYRSVTKTYSYSNDLRHVLQSIIRILNFYRILFYMALAILLFVLSVSFITGLLVGVELKAVELGASWIELGSSPQMAKTIILGVMLLLAFVTGFFILFRWGYRKLYGNYIAELKKTLQELDEIERFD